MLSMFHDCQMNVLTCRSYAPYVHTSSPKLVCLEENYLCTQSPQSFTFDTAYSGIEILVISYFPQMFFALYELDSAPKAMFLHQ